ncbi:hypothetical protein [Acanthopleuribacter pedis]|uniref:Uncharacterized protein n=1 Tax=Acanthopleuribacter pedis TaxID=442870 RepID=A0A8J7QIW1_9BACT|nr:hypothetical protein [Acanthopleuribacter pedis]MBO1321596.1 hypothetical protein [Acanthopleuribacter pedis]
MIAEEVNDNHPLRLLDEKTGLPNAEISLILARSGVGKSAALINFAIDTLLDGHQVLHFSAGMDSAKVHDYYQEIYTAFLKFNPEDRSHPWEELNNHLMVVSYRDSQRMINDLDEEIETIHRQARLSPSLVIVDGLDFDGNAEGQLRRLHNLAGKHKLRILSSMRIHRNADGSLDLEGPRQIAMKQTSHLYFMEPHGSRSHLEFQTPEGQTDLPVYFCHEHLVFRPA